LPPARFQVVVLAAGAHALLRGSRPLVGTFVKPQEDILELIHPRVGKQQRGVTVRDEGTRGNDLVLFAAEKLEKRLTNRCGFHRGSEKMT